MLQKYCSASLLEGVAAATLRPHFSWTVHVSMQAGADHVMSQTYPVRLFFEIKAFAYPASGLLPATLLVSGKSHLT